MARMSRRQMLAGVGLGVGASVLAACGQVQTVAAPAAPESESAAAPQEPAGITGVFHVWGYRSQYLPGVVLDAFQEMHPGAVVVQSQPAGNFRGEKFPAAVAAGAPPALMQGFLDFVAMYVDRGFLADLGPAAKAGDFGDLGAYLPGIVETGTFNGVLHFLPHRQSVNIPLYNKDMFENAGINEPPTQWDDVAEIARQLTKKNADGSDQFGLSVTTSKNTLNSWFNPVLWQAGGEFFAEDGRSVTFDEDPGLAALEFLTDLFNKKIAAEGTTPYFEGYGAMINARTPTHVKSPFDRGTIPWLAASPAWQKEKQLGFGSLSGWVVPNSPQSDAAIQLLAHTLQPENVKAFLKLVFLLPVRGDIEVDYVDEKYNDWMPTFIEQSQNMHYDIPHPHIRAIMPLVSAEMYKAIGGEVTPQEAIRTAGDIANQFLDDNMG